MKKFALTILMLTSYGLVYALPVGNPAEASLFTNGALWDNCYDPYDPVFCWCEGWSIRAGFSGDYVFNRHLAIDHTQGGDIDITSIHTNAGYLVLNFCDRVDIFGTIGESKLHIRTDASSWGALTSLESELMFDAFLSWGIGGRATLLECCGFVVGVEGEYFQTVPDISSFLNYNDGTLTYFGDDADAFYSEWQVGLGLAYRFVTGCPAVSLTPYAAVKWASSKLKLDEFQFDIVLPSPETLTLHDLHAKKHWGYAIGITLTLSNMIGVTVEGRFADERAIYVNGQARF